jgi:hypothetical protein
MSRDILSYLSLPLRTEVYYYCIMRGCTRNTSHTLGVQLSVWCLHRLKGRSVRAGATGAHVALTLPRSSDRAAHLTLLVTPRLIAIPMIGPASCVSVSSDCPAILCVIRSSHYGSQSRGRRPRAIGTDPEAVDTGYVDGGRWHKAVGLGRCRHSQKKRRHRYAVGRRLGVGIGNYNFYFIFHFFKKIKLFEFFYTTFLLLFD